MVIDNVDDFNDAIVWLELATFRANKSRKKIQEVKEAIRAYDDRRITIENTLEDTFGDYQQHVG